MLLLGFVAVVLMPCVDLGTPSVAELHSDSLGRSATQYEVTFTESGLPNGATWNLTLLGRTWNTTNESLSILLANGTYSYSAYAAEAFNSVGARGAFQNGSFTVAGKPVTEGWTWAGPPTEAPGNRTAAAPSETVNSGVFFPIAIGVVAVALVIAIGLAVAARRPGVRPPPPPGPSGPPPGRPVGTEPERPGEEGEGSDPLSHML
jgi:hypothetical protein